ncbi:unnamed protein product [marine sediment metagenome]|uniref:Uncharacterized protein n=1 Tax=marine sediment metagenome TaxID=412755 RepID=X1AXG7_9ZZZZ
MDTSKEYINMCDCPEIQEKKVAIRNKDNFVQVEIGKRVYYVWLPRQDDIQEILSEKLFAGLFVLDNTDIGARLSYMTGRFKDFVHTKCEKMIPLEKNRARIEYLFTSMEQLWLAFYMYEKHRKTWDGEKWLKKQ